MITKVLVNLNRTHSFIQRQHLHQHRINRTFLSEGTRRTFKSTHSINNQHNIYHNFKRMEEKPQEVERKIQHEQIGQHGRTLEDLNFDNSTLRELPMDTVLENYTRTVPNAFFSRVKPTPLTNPKLIHYSPEVLHLLDLDVKEAERPDFAYYLSGNTLLPGSDPAAHCYCGFQFGHFSGQLGDGRAMYLGEVVNNKGERWELQLKGAGKTPYSRTADGRAVLRSSIREFLCSEALYHLGIPTTRAGTIITSDTKVVRDLKYDNNPIQEKATVVLRVAPTFIRFGSFHVANATDPITGRSGSSPGKTEMLKTLADYVIKYHFTEIDKKFNSFEDKVVAWFEELVKRTARMVALWQCVGWAHGVLNTDNMSVLGLTIDYGPFGFLDAYNPDFICNGSDNEGRYSFKNQPSICKWNCEELARSLVLLLPTEKKRFEDAVEKYYESEYNTTFMSKMRNKLGLMQELPEDKKLIDDLLNAMQDTGADYTNTLRCLSRMKLPAKMANSKEEQPETTIDNSVFQYILHQLVPLKTIIKQAKPQVSDRDVQMLVAMAQQNPMMLRMYGVSEEFLLKELQRRERYQFVKELTEDSKSERDQKIWRTWLVAYQERIAKEMQDVENVEEYRSKRVDVMDHNNPKFILRNYIAQVAIEKAEKGDYSEVKRLFDVLKDPYDLGKNFQEYSYDGLPPDWASDICVTCSS